MLSLLLLSFLLIEAGTKSIKHTGCGGSRVLSIDVTPCETEPCMWKKREVAHMSAVVISSVDSNGGILQVTVDLDGLEVEYPGIEPDICKKVQCPIRKGRIYNMTYDVYIEEFFPEVCSSCSFLISVSKSHLLSIQTETIIKWVVMGSGGEGVILCASALVGIKP